MKKKLLFGLATLLFSGINLHAQMPDTVYVPINIDLSGDHVNDTLFLVKRSLRSADFRVKIWTEADGYVKLEGDDVPEVRTYRGYVLADPDLRVNGSIMPSGLLYAYTNDGRECINKFNEFEMDGEIYSVTASESEPMVVTDWVEDRVSPSPQGSVVPKFSMRKLYMGLDIKNDYYVELGSVEEAVARAEQRTNDTDQFYARELGIAFEVREIVVRVDDLIPGSSWKTYWEHDNPESPYVKARVRLKAIGGGGSGGNIWTVDNPDGLTMANTIGTTEAFTKSMGHELGHSLGAGHSMGPGDIMAGSGAYFGPMTVQRMIDVSNYGTATSSPAVVYNSPLAPHARWDFGNTDKDTPLEMNLLENDYDGNLDAISLEYVPNFSKEGGVVEDIGGGMIRYTPPAGFVGVDYFEYWCEDETGITNRTGRVKIRVNTNGLVSYFPMDDSLGFVVHDLGPYNEPCQTTLNFEGKTMPGVKGKALKSPNYSEGEEKYRPTSLVEGAASDPMYGDLSVSLWVNFQELGDKDGVLLCKGGAANGGKELKPYAGWAICCSEDGRIVFTGNTHNVIFNLDESEIFDRRTEADFIETGVWYHLVMILDREANEIRAYINGEEVVDSQYGTYVSDNVIESHLELKMFNLSGDLTAYEYALDEIYIYDKVLTLDEIEDLETLTNRMPAGSPEPFHLADNGNVEQRLAWLPDEPFVYTYDVYFGENYDSVALADHSSSTYMGNVEEEFFYTESEGMKTYYWRIDEVIEDEGVLVEGHVWEFYTGSDYIYDSGALNNPSFELEQVKPGNRTNGIKEWYTRKGNPTRTAWEGYSVLPETPSGDNWAILKNGGWLYQQVGTWMPDQEYEFSMLIGRIPGATFHGVNATLWVGGDPAAAQINLTPEEFGATLVEESGLLVPDIAPMETAYISHTFNTGEGEDALIGQPLWLLIRRPNEYGRCAIDSLGVYSTHPPLVYFNSSEEHICANDTIVFNDLSLNDPSAWHWEFGDGASSELQNPTHIYSAPGTYTVSLTATNEYGESTETEVGYIEVAPLPEVDLGPDLHLEPGEGVDLDAGDGYTDYLWSTGETDQLINVVMSDELGDENLYWVQVVNEYGCEGADSIWVYKDLTSGIAVYPNPNTGSFNILYNNCNECSYSISDMAGKIIQKGTLSDMLNFTPVSIERSILPHGVYVLSIYSGSGDFVESIYFKVN
mgnify:CR=1 FL=1